MADLRQWIPLIIALVLNAAANVLLKVGATVEKPAADSASLVSKVLGFLNAVTLVALFLFGLNILFYRKALGALPLSVAYPVMLSGSLLLATVAARFLPMLDERISPLQLAGMVVIVAGVWMVTRT